MKDGLAETKVELKILINKPTPAVNPLEQVTLSCRFCKHIYTDQCRDNPSPATCEGYEEDLQQSNTDKLVVLVNENAQPPIYFKDQHGEPHIQANDYGISKTYRINSRAFKRYLISQFFGTFGRIPRSDQLKDAMLALESFAVNGPTIELHNRITSRGDGENLEIWIDLCDDKGRSLKVTKDGWDIQNKTPPMFRRYSHMLPFTEPKTYATDDTDCSSDITCTPPSVSLHHKKEGGRGESVEYTSSEASLASVKPLDAFFQFVNIAEKDQLLTKIVIISYFIPGIPHVGHCVHGPKGSAKTSFQEFIKQLVDPSSVQILDLPKNKNELLQTLAHHYFVAFDNVDYINSEVSNIFCRVITGAGAQKRALYTDDEDIVYQLQRCIGLNGINIAAVKEDLLDRLVLLQLEAISPEKRRSKKELLEEFTHIKPYLIYEILEVLSKAIAIYPTLNPPKLLRMADFTKWGCAIAEAMGYTQKQFLDAYEAKANEQVEEALFNDFLGNIFYDFIENRREWSGNASALFVALKEHAKLLGISTRVKEFPKAPHILTRRLNLIRDSLNKLGVSLEQLPDGYRTLRIINNKVPEINSKKCAKCGAELHYVYREVGDLNYCENCYSSLSPENRFLNPVKSNQKKLAPEATVI